MLTRGTIIGKIIDDLAKLLAQIALRNKVGLFDLTKVCEDFFCELLNIIYDLNLINLNGKRMNEPGLDLGDERNKIAFQVTSTKTSQKVSKTLDKVTKEQLRTFKQINIFIIGTQQTKYTIDKKLETKCKFDWRRDIMDVTSISKEIVALDIDKLESLFTLFQRSFREIIIELEPMDAEGNFESSLYHYVEQIPNKPPENVNKISALFGQTEDLENYVKVYKELASIPKSQREYICLIAERGQLTNSGLEDRYEILCTKLANIIGIKEEKLFHNLSYLEEEHMVYFVNETDEYGRPNCRYSIQGEFLNYLISYLKEAKLSLRRTLVAMDFTVVEG